MNRSHSSDDHLRDLMEEVAAGHVTPADAVGRIAAARTADLGFARVDLERVHRRGRPEAIYCPSKSPEQICAIARALVDAGQPALMTRISAEAADEVKRTMPDVEMLEDVIARALLARRKAPPRRGGTIAVLAAGTSDLPVAREAVFTAESYGSPVDLITDIGVAGLNRLLERLDQIRKARVVIVVAGMEAALTSVVGGLVRAPVIGVPTSVGYGAALEGITPLLGMLTACAPGITVVNIDNGFGAGYFADVINEMGDSAGGDSE